MSQLETKKETTLELHIINLRLWSSMHSNLANYLVELDYVETETASFGFPKVLA
jgi:hypothetical protein